MKLLMIKNKKINKKNNLNNKMKINKLVVLK